MPGCAIAVRRISAEPVGSRWPAWCRRWMWSADVRAEGLSIMIALDQYRWITAVVFLLGGIFAVLISLSYVNRERLWAPEYYVLLLLATVGMMFMGGGLDLIVIFLGLELMSV